MWGTVTLHPPSVCLVCELFTFTSLQRWRGYFEPKFGVSLHIQLLNDMWMIVCCSNQSDQSISFIMARMRSNFHDIGDWSIYFCLMSSFFKYTYIIIHVQMRHIFILLVQEVQEQYTSKQEDMSTPNLLDYNAESLLLLLNAAC